VRFHDATVQARVARKGPAQNANRHAQEGGGIFDGSPPCGSIRRWAAAMVRARHACGAAVHRASGSSSVLCLAIPIVTSLGGVVECHACSSAARDNTSAEPTRRRDSTYA